MGLRSTLVSASALFTLIVSNVSAATYYPYTVETWPALFMQTSPSSYPQYPAYPSPYSPSYNPSSGYTCLYRNAQGECMIEQFVSPRTYSSAPIYTRSYLEEECDRSNRDEDDDDFYDCSYFDDDDDDDDFGAIDDDDFFNDDDDDFFDDEDDFFDDDDD